MIMKKIYQLFSVVLLAACTVSCSDEVIPAGDTSVELKATFPSYVYEDATRVTYNNDLSSFAWDAKDQLRVGYCDDTDNISSAIYTTMNGGEIATFRNEGFKFKPNSSYVAVYPIGMFTYGSMTGISFQNSYETQVQEANGSISHIAKASVMTALLTTDEYGLPTSSTLEFMNRNSVVKLNLNVDAGTYTKAEIMNDNGKTPVPFYFLNRISYYGTTEDYPVYYSYMNEPIKLKLGENGFTTDGSLTLYYVSMPLANATQTNFILTLYDANGIKTEYAFGGKQFEAGKAYQFTPTKIEK